MINPLRSARSAKTVRVRALSLAVAAAVAFAGPASAETPGGRPNQRIVSVGGDVTEIVFALGQQHRLVARDTTSNHPAKARDLADVGYMRRLSPEGMLSVNPDLILATEGSGPPETIELLQEAAINIVEIPGGFSAASVLDKINAVAVALDVAKEGGRLADTIAAAIAKARAAAKPSGKRVLFVLSLQDGRVIAAGRNNAAQGIIELAGGINAVDGFDGYKPLTDEALSHSQADVILMMNRSMDGGMTNEKLFAHPALSTLPAAKTGAVLRMDGMMLLGFSVRTPQAIRILSQALNQGAS